MRHERARESATRKFRIFRGFLRDSLTKDLCLVGYCIARTNDVAVERHRSKYQPTARVPLLIRIVENLIEMKRKSGEMEKRLPFRKSDSKIVGQVATVPVCFKRRWPESH